MTPANIAASPINTTTAAPAVPSGLRRAWPRSALRRGLRSGRSVNAASTRISEVVTMTPPSAVPDSRVEPSVTHVDGEFGQHENDHNHHDKGPRHRVVEHGREE